MSASTLPLMVNESVVQAMLAVAGPPAMLPVTGLEQVWLGFVGFPAVMLYCVPLGSAVGNCTVPLALTGRSSTPSCRTSPVPARPLTAAESG